MIKVHVHERTLSLLRLGETPPEIESIRIVGLLFGFLWTPWWASLPPWVVSRDLRRPALEKATMAMQASTSFVQMEKRLIVLGRLVVDLRELDLDC